MTRYVEPEQALAVIARLGLTVRDAGLLFSALARPATSSFGIDAYDSLELKAAALMSSLARNHALFDGNKRAAWVITIAFLNINGADLDMTLGDKFDLIVATAQGELDLAEIASAIARHVVADKRPAS